MSTRQPYFRRRTRAAQHSADFSAIGDFIDLTSAHLDDYEVGDAVPKAQSLFEARAAACVSAGAAVDGYTLGVGGTGPVRLWPAVAWTPDGPRDPSTSFWARDLLGLGWYHDQAPVIHLLMPKCLPAMAYLDFFPEHPALGSGLRTLVSAAILAASPGWCGSIGPGTDSTVDLPSAKNEGNYDMSQMFLLPLAYQFYPELSVQAREYLITMLLARGRIHRLNVGDTFTSGRPPVDWERAGYLSPAGGHVDVGETENHILTIATARYLTNQLLYQRDHSVDFDNRRNANDDGATCLSILLTLLRNILRGDFSEYNSKPYQAETRRALLCLHAYAYDHEVRLAARMVLDYVSAHIAVSSNDLRRMVPFRRRNEEPYITHDPVGFMTLPLLDPWKGADPMASCFAMQAGNTRGYAAPTGEVRLTDSASDLTMEVLSEYRIPASIQDLFVNDLHRRFYQKLHRTPRSGEMGGNRNCDNMEIYASSPSYLITAGGSTSGYAVDPYFGGVNVAPSKQRQQLGVSVTTSFMPTGHSGTAGRTDDAAMLVQFSEFAEGPALVTVIMAPEYGKITRNYGVAPDFACGHHLHLPNWAQGVTEGGFLFIDMGPDPIHGGGIASLPVQRRADRPGFYLAICQQGELALLEAFDTWLHPGVSFDDFKGGVLGRNGDVVLRENEEFDYVTSNGAVIRAVIWSRRRPDSEFGAEILDITPEAADAAERIDGADRFLNGTIMNSPAEAVVEIANPFLGTTITLDMNVPERPRRTGESGQTEEAGPHSEVWVDFEWIGPSEGDACRPFASIADATAAVAFGGQVRILPGATSSRATITANKPLRLIAPLGGVTLGGADVPAGGADAPSAESITKTATWVQFDYPASSVGHVTGPLTTIADAALAVADGGVIRIVPGGSLERSPIGRGKRFTLRAPIGKVRIGVRDWFGLYDAWRAIGGSASPGGTVAAVARTRDNLDLFIIDEYGEVWTESRSAGSDWTGIAGGWRPLGGLFPVSAVISAIARKPDTIDLFAVDGGGRVRTSSGTGGGDWSVLENDWRLIGGSFAAGAAVSVAARTPDHLDLFAIDLRGRVCTSSWSAGGDWSGLGNGWRPIGGFFPSDAAVSAVARTPDSLDLFVTGFDGRVYTSSWTPGTDWTGGADDWRPIGGFFPAGAPVSAVARTPETIDLFAVAKDGRVHTSSWSASADWSGIADNWTPIGGIFPAAAVTPVCRTPDTIDVFVLSADARVYTSSWSIGHAWSGAGDNWRPIGGFFPADATVAAVSRAPDSLDLFITGADRQVYTNWWPASR